MEKGYIFIVNNGAVNRNNWTQFIANKTFPNHLKYIAVSCFASNILRCILFFLSLMSKNPNLLTKFCNDVNGVRVLVSAAEIMRLSCAFVVIRGRPSQEKFHEDCRFLRRVRKLDTVRRGICKSRQFGCPIYTHSGL